MNKTIKNWRTYFGLLFMIAALFLILHPSTALAVVYSSDVIPAMTGYTSPSGIASASTDRPADPAWMAFDNDAWSTSWATANGGTHWLAYEFNTPKIITKYSFSTVEAQGDVYCSSIRHVSFEGYDEATQSWNQLHSSDIEPTVNQRKEFVFEINNTKAYKKYRINASNETPDPFLIFELDMFETITIPANPANLTAKAGLSTIDLSWDAVTNAKQYKLKKSSDNMNFTDVATLTTTKYTDSNVVKGKNYYYKVTAVNEAGESTGSASVGAYVKIYSSNIIPVMTGYTTPSGVVRSDSERGSIDAAWQAFDGNTDTTWATVDGNLHYVEYEFPTPKIVTKYLYSTMECDGADSFYTSIDYAELRGYNEETSEWVQLHKNGAGGQYEELKTYEYGFDNTKAYKKYRLYAKGNLPDYPFLIFTLEMYEALPIEMSTKTTHIENIDLAAAKKINRIMFNLNNIEHASLPSSFTVEGYNSASNQWEVVNYTGSIVFGANQFILNNTKAYEKYRLNLGFNASSPVSMSGLMVYGSD